MLSKKEIFIIINESLVDFACAAIFVYIKKTGMIIGCDALI
ncbi:MAG TPA: hypothetical protein VF868_01950 [Bacteroidia bacterium]|jgi:hypothetical protein